MEDFLTFYCVTTFLFLLCTIAEPRSPKLYVGILVWPAVVVYWIIRLAIWLVKQIFIGSGSLLGIALKDILHDLHIKRK